MPKRKIAQTQPIEGSKKGNVIDELISAIKGTEPKKVETLLDSIVGDVKDIINDNELVELATDQACLDLGLTLEDEAKGRKHFKIITMLVENGYGISYICDKISNNPLTTAILKGPIELVACLIDLGATLDRVHDEDDYGLTPLGNAARRGDKAIAKLLLDNGAPIDDYSWVENILFNHMHQPIETAFMFAYEEMRENQLNDIPERYQALIDFLVERGATKLEDSGFPLHVAVWEDDLDLLNRWLPKVDLNSEHLNRYNPRYDCNVTPLETAEKFEAPCDEIVEALQTVYEELANESQKEMAEDKGNSITFFKSLTPANGDDENKKAKPNRRLVFDNGC